MVTQETAVYEPAVAEMMRCFMNRCRRKTGGGISLEAQRIGHGGIRLVAEVLGCSEHTIERGMPELAKLPEDPAAGRVRRSGGGRKKR